MTRFLRLFSIFLIILVLGCGYRFVTGSQSERFSLVSLRNSTSEPGLASLVEDALLKVAGIGRGNKGLELRIVLTDFSEVVQTVSSAGEPVRQKVSLIFEWRTDSLSDAGNVMEKDKVERSYLWSPDPVTLDWNRRAALKLLGEDAASAVSDGLERLH